MTTERRLARLILDLARNHPELAQLYEVNASEPVIVEGQENHSVFLILSGQFRISRDGRPICDDKGVPVVSTTGSILGELSALRGGVASATVAGDGVVFGIEMSVIQQQLADNQEFRKCMEELTQYRIQ
jgi:CRP-like cAMP-binding protein